MNKTPFQNLRITILSLLGYVLYRIVLATLRWEQVGFEGENEFWSDKKARIIVFWHNQQIFMPFLWTSHHRKKSKKPIHVLISQHGDGRIIAGIIEKIGLRSIAGSSSRGGKEALLKMKTLINNDCHVGITPDGPRGPIYKSKPGVIKLAQATNKPITPCAIFAEKKWTFKSWDKMFLPKPFSRIVIMMGEDISVPREMNDEDFLRYQEKIDNTLNQLTEESSQFLKQ